jgi:hypothetical protein
MGEEPASTPNEESLHWYMPNEPAGTVIGGMTGVSPLAAIH